MTTAVMRLALPGGGQCRGHAAAAAAFRPWFRADWRDVLFVHYAVDPAILRPHVPFELDLYGGRAWVSLVAFTQERLRPAIGGPVGAAFMRPVARHEFLNMRTYVRAGGHRAIQFLAEWIPNRLAMLVGPSLYGLPFRLGHLDYRAGRRDVRAGGAGFRAGWDRAAGTRVAAGGSLEAFLLERYTAVTSRYGRGRMFHIAHEPWAWRNAGVRVEDDSLIRRAAPWFAEAQPACAHHSDGAFDVGIGGPEGIPVGAGGQLSGGR